MKTTEQTLHQQVADYLRLQYPLVLFRTDFAAGQRMTMGQAVKHRRLQACRAWPDLFIAERRGLFSGLFLELKREGTQLWKQDGSMRINAHVLEQQQVLEWLLDRGYDAKFVIGFEHAKRTIDNYLNCPAGDPQAFGDVPRSKEIKRPVSRRR